MIEMIAPIEAIQAPVASATAAVSAPAESGIGAFSEVFASQLSTVNADISKAEGALQALASGQPVELHDVMISLEQARIGVQTVIQIRNRMVEAYQELARMQI